MARTTSKGLALTYYQEIPSGTVNGSNTSFTLAHTPFSQTELILFLDAIPQLAGTDFTLSGSTITMTVAPATNQQLWARYLNLVT